MGSGKSKFGEANITLQNGEVKHLENGDVIFTGLGKKVATWIWPTEGTKLSYKRRNTKISTKQFEKNVVERLTKKETAESLRQRVFVDNCNATNEDLINRAERDTEDMAINVLGNSLLNVGRSLERLKLWKNFGRRTNFLKVIIAEEPKWTNEELSKKCMFVQLIPENVEEQEGIYAKQILSSGIGASNGRVWEAVTKQGGNRFWRFTARELGQITWMAGEHFGVALLRNVWDHVLTHIENSLTEEQAIKLKDRNTGVCKAQSTFAKTRGLNCEGREYIDCEGKCEWVWATHERFYKNLAALFFKKPEYTKVAFKDQVKLAFIDSGSD